MFYSPPSNDRPGRALRRTPQRREEPHDERIVVLVDRDVCVIFVRQAGDRKPVRSAFQSGRPIFVQLSPSNQNSNTGSTRDRPNVGFYDDTGVLQPGAAAVIKDRTDKTIYLDRNAFSVPPRGTFGNAPRNYFDGPGTNNWDLMLGKNFRYEGVNVQFRTEFFNALNHPLLNQPNRNPDSQSFGTITSTLMDNREIQFGLKITY